MRCEQFGILGIQLNLLVGTDINLSEIILIEIIVFQDFGLLQELLGDNLLVFQLRTGSENESCSIQGFVLSSNQRFFYFVLSHQIVDILSQTGNGIVQFRYADVLGCQFGL